MFLYYLSVNIQDRNIGNESAKVVNDEKGVNKNINANYDKDDDRDENKNMSDKDTNVNAADKEYY